MSDGALGQGRRIKNEVVVQVVWIDDSGVAVGAADVTVIIAETKEIAIAAETEIAVDAVAVVVAARTDVTKDVSRQKKADVCWSMK